MCVQLTVIGGPHLGKQYEFPEHDSFIVGRGKQAHFRLPRDDQYFSRVHFMVEVNPPLCRLLDVGSRNGTKVNGLRVTSVDLQDGDVIEAGKTRIRVAIARSSEATASAAATVITTPDILLSAEELLPEDESREFTSRELGNTAPIIADDADLPIEYAECIRRHPQPIAGYYLVRELGRGGMGTVYLAIRQSDRAVVAVKTVQPGTVASSRDQQRFLREAEILQQLIHPHIVAHRGSGECDGLLYFSMEYVPGIGADELVRKCRGQMPVSRAVRIALQTLTALRYAHAEGFVHRDIKPSNLLIVESESGDRVKLADFGLARAYQASGMSGLTMTGEIGGTISYMAPEQITDFRRAQPVTDQYAVAATLYNLLTGKFVHDFPDDPGRRLLMILDQEPVPIRQRRPDVPEGLAVAIHRALSREAKNRFPDIRDFYAAIEPFDRKST